MSSLVHLFSLTNSYILLLVQSHNGRLHRKCKQPFVWSLDFHVILHVFPSSRLTSDEKHANAETIRVLHLDRIWVCHTPYRGLSSYCVAYARISSLHELWGYIKGFAFEKRLSLPGMLSKEYISVCGRGQEPSFAYNYKSAIMYNRWLC